MRSFGARGDGTTDNTAALQRALDAAHNNGGGTVYVPAGTYAVSSVLHIGNRTWLKGDGMSATVVRRVGSQYVNVLENRSFQSPGNHDITVSDITLDNNAAAGGGNHVVRFTYVACGTIERARLTSGRSTNFSVQGGGAPYVSRDITVRDSQIVNSGDSGIDWENVQRFSVTNNTFYNNAQIGINMEPTDDSEAVRDGVVSGNTISAPNPVSYHGNAARYGIHIQGWSWVLTQGYNGIIQNVRIVDNKISDQLIGVIAQGARATSNEISGNTVTNVGHNGVRVGISGTSTTGTRVVSNRISNVSLAAVDHYSAIELQAAQQNTVENNTISDDVSPPRYSYPIAETAGSTNNTITGNTW